MLDDPGSCCIWKFQARPFESGDDSSFQAFFDMSNIFAPGNGWLEDEFPFGVAQFQGLC